VISRYATLRRTVHRYKLHKHVRFFGFVPDATWEPRVTAYLESIACTPH
jgi:uncharacterized membrane protein